MIVNLEFIYLKDGQKFINYSEKEYTSQNWQEDDTNIYCRFKNDRFFLLKYERMGNLIDDREISFAEFLDMIILKKG